MLYDIPLHVCLSDYFKGESERRGGVIRDGREMMVNGPGGVLALSETFEIVKKTKKGSLSAHFKVQSGSLPWP